MDAPPGRPFAGRRKWRAVLGYLVLATLGAALATAGFVGVPADAAGLRVLTWYTVGATAATLALAGATAATRQLPTLRPGRLDGAPATVLRAWPGEWRYDAALELGLVAAATALAVLGVRAASDWTVPLLMLGPVAAWLVGRVALTLTGRRRLEALWLTADEVVHDATWGRARADRGQITRVRRLGATAYVALDVAGAVRRELCPRPWRGRVRVTDALVLDCSWTGHDPGELATALAAELRVPGGP